MESFLHKKAYEIGYALFRVGESVYARHASLSETLERNGVQFLECVTRGAWDEARMPLGVLKYVVRMASDVGAMNREHGDAILSELETFEAHIAAFHGAREESPVPLTFSEWSTAGNGQDGNEAKNNSAPSNVRRENGNGENAANGSGERQSAILSRMRQCGNCRVKEFQELLPEVSERTIRYDLQKLVERQLVERVGNGGPATFYRAIQKVS